MSEFHRVGQSWDYTQTMRELAAQRLAWGRSPRVTFPGSPHQDSMDIILRGPEKLPGDTLADLHMRVTCTDYDAAELFPLSLTMASSLAYLLSSEEQRADGVPREVGRVILTKLSPNKTIHPHKDEGPVPDYYARFHLVVQGGDENIFMVNGKVQPMLTGEMWEVDVRQLHTVINLMD
ncbi:MAG: hypothetical protein E4H01_01995, partial [Lysobacterales bacterium]